MAHCQKYESFAEQYINGERRMKIQWTSIFLAGGFFLVILLSAGQCVW
jgi:hypothetical protein